MSHHAQPNWPCTQTSHLAHHSYLMRLDVSCTLSPSRKITSTSHSVPFRDFSCTDHRWCPSNLIVCNLITFVSPQVICCERVVFKNSYITSNNNNHPGGITLRLLCPRCLTRYPPDHPDSPQRSTQASQMWRHAHRPFFHFRSQRAESDFDSVLPLYVL